MWPLCSESLGSKPHRLRQILFINAHVFAQIVYGSRVHQSRVYRQIFRIALFSSILRETAPQLGGADRKGLSRYAAVRLPQLTSLLAQEAAISETVHGFKRIRIRKATLPSPNKRRSLKFIGTVHGRCRSFCQTQGLIQ